MNELTRTRINHLEEAMRGLDGYEEGDGHCRIRHLFAPGVYLREMWIPAGCLITGKIHKTKHACILSQGKVTVSNGEDRQTLTAPHTIIAPIGSKRAIYAHEDSIWTNIHPTELTDPEEVEKEVIAESFEEIDALLEQTKRIE